MKTESKQEQYAAYLRNGGTMTLQQWENDSRYDPHLAGERSDPDSGEIRPSWKPGQKQGEAALIEQIASLQKQLDDCLHGPDAPKPSPEDLEKVSAVTINLLIGAFSLEESADPWPWVEFRNEVFSMNVQPLFSDPYFIHGMSVLNKVIDRLQAIYHEAEAEIDDRDFGPYNELALPDKTWYLKCWQSIPRIIMGANKASEHEMNEWEVKDNLAGFIKLREAFNLLTRDGFRYDRYMEVKVLLDLIIWCLGYAAKYKDQE